MGKIAYNPIILIIFTLVSMLFFMSLRKNAQKTQVSNRSIESLETEVSELAIELNQAQENLEKAQDPIEKEKIIRNELLMQKEGEYILRLPEIVIEEEKTEVEDVKPVEAWWGLVR